MIHNVERSRYGTNENNQHRSQPDELTRRLRSHNLMSTFQNTLASELKQRGWNQIEAARHLGISQALVSAYLRGEREPMLSTASQIARALGISLDELAGKPQDIK